MEVFLVDKLQLLWRAALRPVAVVFDRPDRENP
jgi:hypothetical protein